ncbi:MAG: glycosyltransferase family 2 protein [Chitinophagaceae bacterium]|nr:glycosyltransferase family 2 protein [Chitinophagaceae bacterium]
MNEWPSIAIVLLNFNGKELLERNLPYIIQTSYPNKKIIVIDNASSDGSAAFLQSHYPGIQLIQLPANKGYAGGYNEGLQHVTADYFILLNTDVEVTHGFIEPLVHLLSDKPEAGICQPKIISLENRHQFEYAGAAGGFMDKYGYTFARGRILDTSEKDNGQYNDVREIFWASGACFMIKASLFRELNGFYDYFFMYAEEVDLCWRARLAGQKIVCCPSSVVFHKETDDFASQSPARIYYVFRNNLIMLLRNLTLYDKMWIIPARVVLNMAAAFHFMISGYFKKAWLVIRSLFASFYWLLFVKKQPVRHKRAIKKTTAIYKKSILADYYFRGRKKFTQLDPEKF